MSRAFATVIKYFEKEHKGFYTVDPEQQMVRMNLRGEREDYALICNVVDLETVNVTIAQIIKVPEEKMRQACLLANIVNWRTIATFTIDPDGDLMATVAILGKCTGITTQAIRVAYLRAFGEAVAYYPAFYQVVNSDVIPEEALHYVEEAVAEDMTEFTMPYSRLLPLKSTPISRADVP